MLRAASEVVITSLAFATADREHRNIAHGSTLVKDATILIIISFKIMEEGV